MGECLGKMMGKQELEPNFSAGEFVRKSDNHAKLGDVEVAVDPHGGKSFDELYRLGDTLGSGAFSVVRDGTYLPTGEVFAVKCVKKSSLTEDDVKGLMEEVDVLKRLNHPNIMNLFDFFETETMYYLVTERLEGGELFDRIVEKEWYSEKEARDTVALLLEALNYCHSNYVVHRDLKPENLLLTSRSDDSTIKLADFGFARAILPDRPLMLTTACGTPGYVAPEILQNRTYGCAVDIWSAGVITYILLSGYPPFHHDNQSKLFEMIIAGKFEFDSPYWDHVSDDAKDLIRRMLVKKPSQRATAAELLRHPWIAADGHDLSSRDLALTVKELKKFNARRRFKKGVDAVIAVNIMRHALGGLGKKASADGEGESEEGGAAAVVATPPAAAEEE